MGRTQSNHTLHRQLKKEMGHIGKQLSRSLAQALKAVEKKDAVLARELISGLQRLHGRENASLDVCVRILALTKGNTDELRWTSRAYRILSLMGQSSQEIEEIARKVEEIEKTPELPLAKELPLMGQVASSMLRESIQAAICPDADDACRIIAADSSLDRSKEAFKKKVAAFLSENPEAAQPVTPHLFISKHLERIGDHASHIAEEVAYFLQELNG